ncbi:MAG: RNA polymerase sigma factor [Polyangiales bacterium]
MSARSSLSPETMAILVENRDTFLAFLERRTGNRALAEDVLQDAFTRSISTETPLDDADAVTAWFYRTLRNTLIDHARRADSRKRAYEAIARELDESFDPELDAKNRLCTCVSRIATGLEPKLAEVIRRIDVEGASIAEFAAEQGITANNARVRLFRARAALREQVKASCGSCAASGCVDCTCAGPAPTPAPTKSCCSK